MIDKALLEEYDRKQKYAIKISGEKIKTQNRINKAADFYPDVKLDKSLGFARGDVPLKALMLLYNQVVVKVPPLSIDKLEDHLGMSYSDFLICCEKKVIIPIIEDVFAYKQDHFARLLSLNAPSLFSRGTALLELGSMSDALTRGEKLATDKKLYADREVINAFRNKISYTKTAGEDKKIIRDTSILYADLSLFGYDDYLEEITVGEPSSVYKNLKLFNELLTYPILFGLGGTANFSTSKIASDRLSINCRADSLAEENQKSRLVSSGLLNLFSFFDIAAERLSVKEIIAFQQKGGCAKLRNACDELEKSVIKKARKQGEELHGAQLMERTEQALEELYLEIDPALIRNMEKRDKILKIGAGALSLSIGGAVAAFGGAIPAIASFVLAKGIEFLSGERISSAINKLMLSGTISPAVSSVWDAKKMLTSKK